MQDVYVGLAAGVLTTFAGVPQLVRVVSTRSAGDLSLVALLMFTAGIFLWLIYGLLVHSLPVTLWNAISLGIYLGLVVARVRFREQAPRRRVGDVREGHVPLGGS